MTQIEHITVLKALSIAAEVSKNGYTPFHVALQRSFAVRKAINKMADAGRTQEDVERIVKKVNDERLDDFRSPKL